MLINICNSNYCNFFQLFYFYVIENALKMIFKFTKKE